MSTESDLKALEPWASVIDPNGTVTFRDASRWPHWYESTAEAFVSPRTALAIRLEQAREWLRARCKDTADSFGEGYHPAAFSNQYHVEINGAWMGMGDSPAEALADAIKNILDLGKKGGAK